MFRDGPYLDTNVTATTLSLSAMTGSITINASGTAGINGGQGFLVGRLVSVQRGGTWGWARITDVNSTTQVLAGMGGNFGGTGAVSTWRLGLWSDTTGWPATVTFYEQRLIFAGGCDHPQRIDG